MNSIELSKLVNRSTFPSFHGRITEVRAPFPQSAANQAAGFHLQDLRVLDLETNQTVTVRLTRPQQHLNEDVLGKVFYFEKRPNAELQIGRIVPVANKAEYNALVEKGQSGAHLETWFIQIPGGAYFGTVPSPDMAPPGYNAQAAAAPVAAPAPTPAPAPAAQAPAPVAAPAPKPAPAPVTAAYAQTDAMGLPRPAPASLKEVLAGNLAGRPATMAMNEEGEPDVPIHPDLMDFARGQAACRIAAARAFKEVGMQIAPEQLGGVATSLFIQLSQKGVLAEVIKHYKKGLIEQAVPATFQQAAAPVAEKPAPAVTAPDPAKPTPAAAPKPAPTPAAAPAPAAASTPTPAPVTETAAPAAAPKAPKAPAEPNTKETLLAKYRKAVEAGNLTGDKLSSLSADMTRLGLSWELTGQIVIEIATAKHGAAFAEAAKEDIWKVLAKVADEAKWRGISCAPDKYLAQVLTKSKAAA